MSDETKDKKDHAGCCGTEKQDESIKTTGSCCSGGKGAISNIIDSIKNSCGCSPKKEETKKKNCCG